MKSKREDRQTEEKPVEKKDPIRVSNADCPRCGASLSSDSFLRVVGWADTHVALHRYWDRRGSYL